MRGVILSMAVGFLSLASLPALASYDVPYYSSFQVVQPKVWSAGSKVCYAYEGRQVNCPLVTSMPEIQLRFEGRPGNEAQDFLSKLSTETQAYVGNFDKFVVRFLALEPNSENNQPNFFVEVLFTVYKPGTQSIMIFGNYDPQTLSIKPIGYGVDDEYRNPYLLRRAAGIDDQDLIRIGLEVTNLYLQNQPKPVPEVAPKP